MACRIIDYCRCDRIGRPLAQLGGGIGLPVSDEVVQENHYEDWSGKGSFKRLVFRLTVSHKDGTTSKCVLKIAPVFEEQIQETLCGQPITMQDPYIHEARMYEFFRKNGETQGDAKCVLHSHGSGYSVLERRGTFVQWEPDVKLDDRSLDLPETLVDQVRRQLNIWEQKRKDVRGLSWLITEFNENYVTLALADTRLSEYQKNRVMGSLLKTVSDLWVKYKFCHWDLHSENVLFDQTSFQVVMFDFDLSTVDEDNLRFSDYIFRLSFLKNIICHMSGENPNINMVEKNLQKVGSYYDILNIYVDFNKPIKGGLAWPENLTSHPKRQQWKELTEQGFDKLQIPYKVPKLTERVKDGTLVMETVEVTPDGHFIFFGLLLLKIIFPTKIKRLS